jgi:hypothetical protein
MFTPSATQPSRRSPHRTALVLAAAVASAAIFTAGCTSSAGARPTPPTPAPNGQALSQPAGGPSLTFPDPQRFTYTITAHTTTWSPTGDPQYPVTPAPPGFDYVVIDTTLRNATPGRPAPGDMSQAGLALEVPRTDITAAVSAASASSPNIDCSNLAEYIPNFPNEATGYGGNANYYGKDWLTTEDQADCLITLADASIIDTPAFDGPGTLQTGASTPVDFVTVDALPTSVPLRDMKLTYESYRGNGWTAQSPVTLVR